MTDLSEALQNMQDTLNHALRSLIEYLPYLGAALLLLLAGWLVARLTRSVCRKLCGGLNNVLAGLDRWTHADQRMKMPPATVNLIGNAVFWLIVLLFAAMAARVARLELFTDWLNRIVTYLPNLIAGGLFLLAGYLVSVMIRDLVIAALTSANSPQSALFGRIAQGAIFLAAAVIGLDQIGVDVTFLTILFGILVGGLLLSLALAFGLGARALVANLLGARQLQRLLQPGQVTRIDGMEGRVLELTPTSVILAIEQGTLSVPAKLFQEEATLIVTADDDG